MQMDAIDLKFVEIGLGVLIVIAGFCAGLIIKWFRQDMKEMKDSVEAERTEREAADLKLADLLNQTANALNAHRLTFEQRMGTAVYREDMDKRQVLYDHKVDKLHDRLDEIQETLVQIRLNMVTKQECIAKRDCPE